MKYVIYIFEWISRRLLHLIWLFSTKKELTIDDEQIQYIAVTKYVIWGVSGSKQIFADARCLVHKASKTLMIFISHKQCKSSIFRYSLFHEFVEGSIYLRDYNNFLKRKKSTLEKIYRDLENDFPEALDVFRKSFNYQPHHTIALVFEFDLARREMEPPEFNTFLQHMLKYRV